MVEAALEKRLNAYPPHTQHQVLKSTVYVANHLASQTRQKPESLNKALETRDMESLIRSLAETAVRLGEVFYLDGPIRNYHRNQVTRNQCNQRMMALFQASLERPFDTAPRTLIDNDIIYLLRSDALRAIQQIRPNYEASSDEYESDSDAEESSNVRLV